MGDFNLEEARLFSGMDREELQAALESLQARSQTYEKGEIILRAGSQTEWLCLVLAGGVTIENNDIWGNRTILNLMGPGDFFAETYAILREEPLLVDAVASEACRVLFLRVGPLLEGAFDAMPWSGKLIRNLLRISASKNRMLSGRAFHISPKTARGRIMAYLNSVSLQKHSRVFHIPFDRQQMADYLNLERTALSKELGRMRREKIIDFRKNRFQILP